MRTMLVSDVIFSLRRLSRTELVLFQLEEKLKDWACAAYKRMPKDLEACHISLIWQFSANAASSHLIQRSLRASHNTTLTN